MAIDTKAERRKLARSRKREKADHWWMRYDATHYEHRSGLARVVKMRHYDGSYKWVATVINPTSPNRMTSFPLGSTDTLRAAQIRCERALLAELQAAERG